MQLSLYIRVLRLHVNLQPLNTVPSLYTPRLQTLQQPFTFFGLRIPLVIKLWISFTIPSPVSKVVCKHSPQTRQSSRSPCLSFMPALSRSSPTTSWFSSVGLRHPLSTSAHGSTVLPSTGLRPLTIPPATHPHPTSRRPLLSQSSKILDLRYGLSSVDFRTILTRHK